MMEPRFWTLNKYSLELDGGTNEVTYLEKDSIGGGSIFMDIGNLLFHIGMWVHIQRL